MRESAGSSDRAGSPAGGAQPSASVAGDPLPGEILRILDDERSYAPLSAGSLRNVLRCALGMVVTVCEVEAALDGLLQDGKIEVVTTAKLGRRFRVLRDRGDMSAEPISRLEAK